MSCCGQKRSAVASQLRAQHRVVPAAPVRAARAEPPAADRSLAVTLQYRQRSPITVRGATTGKRYEFLCGGAMQTVDRQDAEALIATGMFDRIRG